MSLRFEHQFYCLTSCATRSSLCSVTALLDPYLVRSIGSSSFHPSSLQVFIFTTVKLIPFCFCEYRKKYSISPLFRRYLKKFCISTRYFAEREQAKNERSMPRDLPRSIKPRSIVLFQSFPRRSREKEEREKRGRKRGADDRPDEKEATGYYAGMIFPESREKSR